MSTTPLPSLLVTVAIALLVLPVLPSGALAGPSNRDGIRTTLGTFDDGTSTRTLEVAATDDTSRFQLPGNATVVEASVELEPEATVTSGNWGLPDDNALRSAQAIAVGVAIDDGLRLPAANASVGQQAVSPWTGYNATGVFRTPGTGWRLNSTAMTAAQASWALGAGVAAWNGSGYLAGTGVEPMGDGRMHLLQGLVEGQRTETMGPREQPAGYWDPTNARFVIHGGEHFSGFGTVVFNDTWALSPATWAWTRLANGPARARHAAAWDWNTGELLFFGGLTGAGGAPTPSGELWRLNATSGNWSRGADGPVARMWPVLVWDARSNRTLLYGGQTANGTQLNDLWAYDSVNDTWQAMAAGPGGRSRMAGSWDYITQRLVIVGGTKDGVTTTNEVWTWEPTGNAWWPKAAAPWSSMNVSGSWGGTGIGTSVFAVMYGGGQPAELWSYTAVPDLWSLKLVNIPAGTGRLLLRQGGVQFWTLLAGSEDPPSSGVAWGCGGSCPDLVSNRVLGYRWNDARMNDTLPVRWNDWNLGGRGDGWTAAYDRDGSALYHMTMADPRWTLPPAMWRHNLTTGSWELAPAPLTPYTDAVAAFDSRDRAVYVTGGSVYNVPGDRSDYVLDTYRLWDDLTWQGRSDSNVDREGHTFTWAEEEGAAILFGGHCTGCGGASARIISLDGAANQWKELIAAPVARHGHAAVWDPGRDELLVMGGSSDTGALDDVAAYAPAPRIWRAAGALPVGLGDPVAAAYEPSAGRIFVFGDTEEIWAYYPGNDTWRRLGSFPFPSWRGAALFPVAPDELLLVGSGRTDPFSLRLVPSYPADGSFESSIFDAGGVARWDRLEWTLQRPTGGQTLRFQTRSGNSPVPDAGWAPWSALQSTPGTPAAPAERFLQYRALLHTEDTRLTPVLGDVTLAYTIVEANGTIESPVIDLGAPPAAFTAFRLDVALPPGTTATATLRTAADPTATWSMPLTWDDVPPARWVTVRISLGSGGTGASPVLAGWELNTSTFAAEGSYDSTPWHAPYPIPLLVVSYRREGNVTVEMSNDGGQDWFAAPAGLRTFPKAGEYLAFRVTLHRSADGRQGALVRGLSVLYQAGGFPEDVVLAVKRLDGPQTTKEVWARPGTMNESSGPVDLAPALQELLTLQPGDAPVGFALVLSVSRPSDVTVQGFRVVYDIPAVAPPPAVRYGVEVLPPAGQTVSGESFVEYTFRIRNTGSAADRFAFAANSSQGWRVTFLTNETTGPVAPGASTEVTVQLQVPAVRHTAVTDLLTLEAASLGDAAAHHAASVATLANPSEATDRQEPGLGWLPVTAIIAGIVGLLGFMLWRRRRQQPGIAPAPPASADPPPQRT